VVRHDFKSPRGHREGEWGGMKRAIVSLLCALAWGFGLTVGAASGVWTLARVSGIIVPSCCNDAGPVDWLPEELRP